MALRNFDVFSIGRLHWFRSAGTALLISLFVLPGSSEAASIDCEAILRDGVFDKHRVRSLDSRIEQVKSAFCGSTASSQSFSVEVVSGLSDDERQVLCIESADELQANNAVLVDRANGLIMNAFNECAYQNAGGISHGIFTTDDPSVFTYHVQLARDPSMEGQASIDVDAFEVHNASCRPALDRETEIEPGRRTLICTRDPDDLVIVGLNTVGNRGTRYLEPLRLNAYSEMEAAPLVAGVPPATPVETQEPIESVEPIEPVESSPAAQATVASVTRPYRRFGARRQITESSCNNPTAELLFDVTTEVKLIGNAVAQGRSRYPLWIRLKAGDEVHCERQAWPKGRGSVSAVCMVWVEANRPLHVEAVQGSEGASCLSTELEVWY